MGAEADLTLDPVQYNLKITLKNMVKSMMPNFICERHCLARVRENSLTEILYFEFTNETSCMLINIK